MTYTRFTLLIVVTLFLSCGSTKNQIINPLHFSTGPCKGFCPEYSVQIEKNALSFEGVKNTLKQGNHNIKLSEEQIKTINSYLSKVSWKNVKEQYNETIYDLPEKKIKYLDKEISFKSSIPEHQNVYKLTEFVEQILSENQFIR